MSPTRSILRKPTTSMPRAKVSQASSSVVGAPLTKDPTATSLSSVVVLSSHRLSHTIHELTDFLSSLEDSAAVTSLPQRLGRLLVERDIKVAHWMKELDKNGDGSVSKLEFRVHLRSLLGSSSVPAEMREIDDLFATLDRNNTGILDLAELRVAMKKLQEEASELSVRIARYATHNASFRAVIETYQVAIADTTEFERAVSRLDMLKTDTSPAARLGALLAKRNIKIGEVARKWDSDGSGSIDLKEFRRHVRAMGFVGTDTEISRVFDQFDIDESEELDVGELKGALKTLQDAAAGADAEILTQETSIGSLKKAAKASQKAAGLAKLKAEEDYASDEAAAKAEAAAKVAAKALKVEQAKAAKEAEAAMLLERDRALRAEAEVNLRSSTASDLECSHTRRFNYNEAQTGVAVASVSAAHMAYEAKGETFIEKLDALASDGWLRSDYHRYELAAENRAHYKQQRQLQDMARDQLAADQEVYLRRARANAAGSREQRRQKAEEVKMMRQRKADEFSAMKAEAAARAERAQANAQAWAEQAAQRVSAVKLRSRVNTRQELALERARAAADMRAQQRRALQDARDEQDAQQRGDRSVSSAEESGSAGRSSRAFALLTAEEKRIVDASAFEAETARNQAAERAREARKREKERKIELAKGVRQVKNLTQLAQEERLAKTAAKEEQDRLAAEAVADAAAEATRAAEAAAAEAAANAEADRLRTAAEAVTAAELERKERKALARRAKADAQKKLLAGAMNSAQKISGSAMNSVELNR